MILTKLESHEGRYAAAIDSFQTRYRRLYLCTNWTMNEMAVMLVYQKNPMGIELFSHVKTSFSSKKFDFSRFELALFNWKLRESTQTKVKNSIMWGGDRTIYSVNMYMYTSADLDQSSNLSEKKLCWLLKWIKKEALRTKGFYRVCISFTVIRY